MLLHWVKAAMALIKARDSQYSLLRDWYMDMILLTCMSCLTQVDGSSFSLFESLSHHLHIHILVLWVYQKREDKEHEARNQIKHCRDTVRSWRGHMVDIAQTGW